MFQCHHGFFNTHGDPLDGYFNAARFWGDLDFVMDLTMDELDTISEHTERIAALESEARKAAQG